MNASDRFSLIDRPWLLARHENGTVTELSLLEVFASAHRLLGLVGDVPTQLFAHTRLLLAILHRALAGPRDLDEWQGGRRQARWPSVRCRRGGSTLAARSGAPSGSPIPLLCSRPYSSGSLPAVGSSSRHPPPDSST